MLAAASGFSSAPSAAAAAATRARAAKVHNARRETMSGLLTLGLRAICSPPLAAERAAVRDRLRARSECRSTVHMCIANVRRSDRPSGGLFLNALLILLM